MATSTKKVLSEALKQLLQEKPLDKITVKEIVAVSGVNRQTFYYNFQDSFDLMEWTLNNLFEDIPLDQLNIHNWQIYLPMLLDRLIDNRPMIMNIYHSLSHSTLNYWLHQKLSPLFEKAIDERLNGRRLSEDDKNFMVELFTMSLSGAIVQWIEDDMDRLDLRPMRRMDKLLLLMDGTLEYYINKLSH